MFIENKILYVNKEIDKLECQLNQLNKERNKEFILPSKKILDKADKYKTTHNLNDVEYDLLIFLLSNFYFDLRRDENELVYDALENLVKLKVIEKSTYSASRDSRYKRNKFKMKGFNNPYHFSSILHCKYSVLIKQYGLIDQSFMTYGDFCLNISSEKFPNPKAKQVYIYHKDKKCTKTFTSETNGGKINTNIQGEYTLHFFEPVHINEEVIDYMWSYLVNMDNWDRNDYGRIKYYKDLSYLNIY